MKFNFSGISFAQYVSFLIKTEKIIFLEKIIDKQNRNKDKLRSYSSSSLECKAEGRTDSKHMEWLFEELIIDTIFSYFLYY